MYEFLYIYSGFFFMYTAWSQKCISRFYSNIFHLEIKYININKSIHFCDELCLIHHAFITLHITGIICRLCKQGIQPTQ
jgi:hypothetical protein